MVDVADLISSWQGRDGALPRVTWYGPGGERVELSGQVLANWVIKVANLLTEEADADDGAEVFIDLPVHWRALTWALGAWLTGAQVSFGNRISGDAPSPQVTAPDVLITDRPEQAGTADLLIGVALPALAMSFEGDLPAGALDGAADLMTYPDELVMPTTPADLDDVAGSAWTGPERVLVRAETPGVITTILAIWRAGGSVVLVADPDADADHLARTEGADVSAERQEAGHYD
ncbi:MAG TPA: TIGR03089 family protein [Beutenbergiaceae bacterium]|nr:TIGR03089 family protein [Beutenbergiaceae bacterium]